MITDPQASNDRTAFLCENQFLLWSQRSPPNAHFVLDNTAHIEYIVAGLFIL